MRSRRAFDTPVDYNQFSTPYTAIATMIFVQAANDFTQLGGREYDRVDGSVIGKVEIKNFFRSKWAFFLADCLGWTKEEMEEYIDAL